MKGVSTARSFVLSRVVNGGPTSHLLLRIVLEINLDRTGKTEDCLLKCCSLSSVGQALKVWIPTHLAETFIIPSYWVIILSTLVVDKPTVSEICLIVIRRYY